MPRCSSGCKKENVWQYGTSMGRLVDAKMPELRKNKSTRMWKHKGWGIVFVDCRWRKFTRMRQRMCTYVTRVWRVPARRYTAWIYSRSWLLCSSARARCVSYHFWPTDCPWAHTSRALCFLARMLMIIGRYFYRPWCVTSTRTQCDGRMRTCRWYAKLLVVEERGN